MKIFLLSHKVTKSPTDINSYISCISYGLSSCFDNIDEVTIEWVTFDQLKTDLTISGDILLTCIQPSYGEFDYDYELLAKRFKQLYFFGDGEFTKGLINKVTLSTICPTDKSKFVFNIPWAGFPEHQFPEQANDGFIHILLDHWDYSKDKEGVVIKKYWNALRKIKQEHKIKVDIITPAGIRPFSLNEFKQEDPVQIGGLPWVDLMAELRKYHIFGVTHKESGGLSVLESAMCGSTVIIPRGFIKPLVKKQVIYEETKTYMSDRLGRNIPDKEFYQCLKNALENLDTKDNFDKAREQSWDNVGRQIYKIIKEYESKSIHYSFSFRKVILKLLLSITLTFCGKKQKNSLKEFYKYGR